MKQDPDAKQAQTGDAFAYKWSRRESYESEAMQQKSYRWLVERYFGSEAERERFLEASQGSKILDAGCGSGYSALRLFG